MLAGYLPWLILLSIFSLQSAASSDVEDVSQQSLIKPKVFIISMFEPEGEVWHGIKELDLLAKNVTVNGFSPLFPHAFCTATGNVCQVITGEAEINAATTISALVFSGKFDLTTTYFFIAGIAGISPEVGTLASVTFARFAVQVALQYEFDAREIPENFTTGYVAQGATAVGQYPVEIYGTEVFEVNDALRQLAIGYAKTASLNDSADAIAYRANYNTSIEFKAATVKPSVIACDVATSDVYYSGNLLSQAFDNTTTLLTNGTGKYCTTAQEDNATLEVLLRAAVAKLVDFSRIIVMRTASDFDRPYKGEDTTFHLLWAQQGGFPPSIQNIYVAGIKVVQGILNNWDKTFETGVKPQNYIGDIFGTLGGTPDFGPGKAQEPLLKRGFKGRKGRRMAMTARHLQ